MTENEIKDIAKYLESFKASFIDLPTSVFYTPGFIRKSDILAIQISRIYERRCTITFITNRKRISYLARIPKTIPHQDIIYSRYKNEQEAIESVYFDKLNRLLIAATIGDYSINWTEWESDFLR